MITFAEAVEGRKSAPYSGRIEKGGRGVNGVAFAAKGAASARTLTGSRTETRVSSGPENIDGLPNIPMTETITWNLTLGPVQPKVSIRGPDCGCLDATDPESTPLTFRAGTTVGGGEFSEFGWRIAERKFYITRIFFIFFDHFDVSSLKILHFSYVKNDT